MLDAETANVKPADNAVNPAQSAQIRLDHVSYQYPHAERSAVNDVSLDIHQGDHIALVGPSGAGKTTLSQLILQMREPSQGTVFFNKKNLKLGILSQQPYIFNASIRDNVTMFRAVPDADIMKVIAAVGLADKINALPQGLDTAIGEGGEMLSGGQMRRIELSRVLLDRPEVVVFDEPATGGRLDRTRDSNCVERLLWRADGHHDCPSPKYDSLGRSPHLYGTRTYYSG